MNKSKTEGKLVKVLAIGLLELCVFTAQAEDGRCRPLDLKCKVVTGAREERNSYNEAKAELEAVMNYVNAIINTAVNGGDPATVEEPQQGGCSGSCASCAGCH